MALEARECAGLMLPQQQQQTALLRAITFQ